MYSKDYLKKQILSSFKDKDIEGDLANLISNVLGEYAYLHQLIDVNLLMENSFLRSRNLNSKIQHACDNFYSVPRGRNREVRIEKFDCVTTLASNNGHINPFDLVTKGSSGKYNLYAKDTWNLASGNTYTNSGYLALDMVERVIHGNNKLYIDIGSQNEDGSILPDSNISEQLAVYLLIDDDNNQNYDMTVIDNNGQEVRYINVPIYNSLNEFWQSTELATPSFCAITTPNFGVRLWSKTPIPNTSIFLVKYLVSPNPSIPFVDLNKTIKNIPNCKITEDTNFVLEADSENKLDDMDAIYLYASNNIRTSGVMKSISSLENEIKQCFPEFLSFKMIVGPYGGISSEQSGTNDSIMIQNIVSFSNEYEVTTTTPTEDTFKPIINYVPSGDIYIWYTVNKDPKHESTDSGIVYKRDYEPLNAEHKRIWDERLKAYYIPESTNIYFRNTNELLINDTEESPLPSEHVKVLSDYKIKVYYHGNINFSTVESILDEAQYNIGKDFNPFQIMSDISTHKDLYGIVKYVSIEHLENNEYKPAGIVRISEDQRYWFKEDYSSLIEYVKI